MPGKEGAASSITSGSLPPPPPRSARAPRRRAFDTYSRDPRRGSHLRRQHRASHADPAQYGAAHSGSHRAEQTLVLCVYDSMNSHWRTTSVSFDRHRATDEELWTRIRHAYLNELWPVWRRLLLFKRERFIVPIEFSRNGVPKRQDPAKMPNEHQFLHCYHHPARLRTQHEWVDWFADFCRDSDKTYGLEFVERVWAEKLALVAILLTIAMIVVSVVWVVKGGDLQSVFTVMSFVLSGVAAYIALIALYYQVVLPG